MKHFLLFPYFIFCSISAFATHPNWLNSYQRDVLYPRSNYYIGFVQTEIEHDTQYDEMLKEMKEQARFELISSIRVTVQSTRTNILQSDQIVGNNTFEEITREQYSSTSKIQSEVKDLPGLNVEDWYDAKSKTIYVFAWVNKSDLEKKLSKQIIVSLTKAEMEYDNAIALEQSGEKAKALQIINRIITILNEIEDTQKLLLCVNPSVGIDNLGTTERNELQQRAMSFLNDLDNSISIYIHDSTYIFDSRYSELELGIKQELSQEGYFFVTDQSTSDWIVTLDGHTEEYSVYATTNFTTYTVLAKVKLSLFKVVQNQCVYECLFSEKGTHTLNRENAAMDAYKKVMPTINNEIKRQINK